MFASILQTIKECQTRQVLVIEVAKESDITQCCAAFSALFPDYLFFSDIEKSPLLAPLPLNKTREYLGLTTSAVILDIRLGFPLDYFLSIAATIAAGGILVLLTQAELATTESQRFHETPISTPYFQQYLEAMLAQFAYQWRGNDLIAPFAGRSGQEMNLEPALMVGKEPEDIAGSGADIAVGSAAQLEIMADFAKETAGVFTLFATRGSGKSWLGAALVAANPEHYIVTAPNQNAIEQYQTIVGLQFRAPDALFLTLTDTAQQPQTLIIEEAAKMPLIHLERLCRRFNKVLMISSVENYEGTGQGLREKIQDLVVIKKAYQLHHLQRFNGSDRLNQLCKALMFQDERLQDPKESQEYYQSRTCQSRPCQSTADQSRISQGLGSPRDDHRSLIDLTDCSRFDSDALQLQLFNAENMAELRGNLPQLRALYHLLNATHYQTNIQDLRRLFDSPHQVFVLAYYQGQLIGAIWAMEEGGLSSELTLAVFRGLRRPKGNLVAQMLTGQSYFPEAMRGRSIRISRISVIKSLRRRGIGRLMVQFLEAKVQGKRDFMSVSFGLTQPLLQFWESMQYQMAHLGFHLDKTTGLHSAVVLKDLLPHVTNQVWIKESFQKFRADAALNCQFGEYRPEILQILQEKAVKGEFDSRDQAVIEAFHDFKRAKHTVKNAKIRQKERFIE